MRIRSVATDQIFKGHRHILATGISGCGKTDYLESTGLDMHDTGKYKVIFFDFFKYECCQLGFPETGDLASIIRKKYFLEPKGYPHEVFTPFAITTFDQRKKNKMFIKLPRHKGKGKAYSHWKPFKLSFEQLKVSDLFVVLRMLTESGKVSLDFLHSAKKYKTIEELMKEVIRLASTHEMRIGFKGEEAKAKIGKTEIYQAILRLLSSIQQSGFLCKKGGQYRLSLDKVMRSSEVTTFTLANLDNDDFKFMVFVAILRQIKDLRARKQYKKELLLVIPELADVAPATSKISPEAVVGTYSALNIMQLFSRHSRILKMVLLCDTQNPKDCNRTVRDNFGWVIVGAMQQNVLRWLNENVVRIPDIPYFKIPHLQTGVFCILPLDERFYCYPFFARPSLARHRQRGEAVKEWVARQEGVEVVEYPDLIDNPLQVRMIYRDEMELSQMQVALKETKQEMRGFVQQARQEAKGVLRDSAKRGREAIKLLKDEFKEKAKERDAKKKEKQLLKANREKEMARMKAGLRKEMEQDVLVSKIKELKKEGKSIGGIAKELGKSKSTIHKHLSVRSFA